MEEVDKMIGEKRERGRERRERGGGQGKKRGKQERKDKGEKYEVQHVERKTFKEGRKEHGHRNKMQ